MARRFQICLAQTESLARIRVDRDRREVLGMFEIEARGADTDGASALVRNHQQAVASAAVAVARIADAGGHLKCLSPRDGDRGTRWLGSFKLKVQDRKEAQ